MNELQAALKVLLANAYVMYFRAHSYHWNVEGMIFSQFHNFFGGIYEDVYDSIDDIAEHIRSIQGYAPFSLADVLSAKTEQEDTERVVMLADMLRNLQRANDEMISSLNHVSLLAQLHDKQGLLNYVADRLDKHAKHGWMIRASAKSFGGTND